MTGAVVTIPANFQESQIAATKRAVEMAGLELKLLIEEPIAAAIAYNTDRKLDDSMIMIFDFGGGKWVFYCIIFSIVYLYAAGLEELLCIRLWKSKLK